MGMIKRACILSSFLFLLAGCATLAVKPEPTFKYEQCRTWNAAVTKGNDDFVVSFNGLLDELVTCIPYRPEELGYGVAQTFGRDGKLTWATYQGSGKGLADDTLARLRLLRAQEVVAMAARYGAARIQDYSDDQETEAIRLAGQLDRVEAKLIAAAEKRTQNPVAYPIARADLVLEIMRTAKFAAQPTVGAGLKLGKGVAGLASGAITSAVGVWGDAQPMLRNLFRDVIFLQGYQQSAFKVSAMLESRVQVDGNNGEQLGWKTYADEVQDACNTLAQITPKATCLTDGKLVEKLKGP